MPHDLTRQALIDVSGDKSRCLDAMESAVALLRQGPQERRRLLLLIAQSGDYGSSAQLRDVLRDLDGTISSFTA